MLRRKIALLLTVALTVVVLDQVTKFLVVDALTTAWPEDAAFGAKLAQLYGQAPPQGFDGNHYQQKQAVTVVKRFFRLRYAENPGAAWGMFRDQPESVRAPLFHVVSFGAVLLICWFFFKLPGTDPKEKWARWGLPLVLGGAIGNYMDRLARGFVIDFLEAHWMDRAYFPSFNVADAAICVGVGLLIIDAFVRKETKDVPAEEADHETKKKKKKASA